MKEYWETNFGYALRKWNEEDDLGPLVEFLNSEGSLSPSERKTVARVMEILRRRALPKKRGQRGKGKSLSPVRRAALIVQQHRAIWEEEFGEKMSSEKVQAAIQSAVDIVRENFNAGIDCEQVKALLDKGRDLTP